MEKLIKAYVFDVYGTLFDVFSVKKMCEKLFPEKGEEISQTWRKKQVEYSFLRQLMGTYQPFHEVTRDALRYAIKLHQEELNKEKEDLLMNAYMNLSSRSVSPLRACKTCYLFKWVF